MAAPAAGQAEQFRKNPPTPAPYLRYGIRYITPVRYLTRSMQAETGRGAMRLAVPQLLRLCLLRILASPVLIEQSTDQATWPRNCLNDPVATRTLSVRVLLHSTTTVRFDAQILHVASKLRMVKTETRVCGRF